MAKRLRIPAALAVATLGSAATLAIATSCGGDDAPQDAGGCNVYCISIPDDARTPGTDGGCPMCSELQDGRYVCPAGCTPFA